jgi:membrane-associated phospholipid phosphatase
VLLLALLRVCAFAVAGLHNLDGLLLYDALLPAHSLLWATSSFVTALLQPLPFALWTGLLASLALVRRQPKIALFVVMLCVGATATTEALKPLLAEQRFFALLGDAQISADSFPSGHATAALALAVSALVTASPKLRPYAAVGGLVLFASASYSVLALGWHYPSDLVGGLLVVAFWAALLDWGFSTNLKQTANRFTRRVAR